MAKGFLSTNSTTIPRPRSGGLHAGRQRGLFDRSQFQAATTCRKSGPRRRGDIGWNLRSALVTAIHVLEKAPSVAGTCVKHIR
jgi:hypothetical protein